mgnify:CR=1 FL=1
MIPFPNISPEIFSITIGETELALRWYALSYIAGFVAAGFIMRFYINRTKLWPYQTPPLELHQAESIITYLIVGVIFGGRVGYVLFYNFDFYLANPIDVIRIWDGGMSFHGGFLGVIFAVIFYCRFHGIPLLSCADIIAISTPPGLLFGRVANFINAELWGRPTNVTWGVVFPGERAQDCPGVIGACARHPSQLYEAGLEGLLLFSILITLSFFGMLKRAGFLTGIFFIGYGSARYFVEFFRVADPQFITSENPLGYAYKLGEIGISMGQVLSLPMIVIGIIFVFISHAREKV